MNTPLVIDRPTTIPADLEDPPMQPWVATYQNPAKPGNHWDWRAAIYKMEPPFAKHSYCVVTSNKDHTETGIFPAEAFNVKPLAEYHTTNHTEFLTMLGYQVK